MKISNLQAIRAAIAAGLFVSVFTVAPLSAASSSKSPTMALSGDVGTTGAGASLWITASKKFVVTVGYNGLNTSLDVDTDDINYDSKFKLSNGHALLRFYPAGGRFNLTAGAMLANNKVDVTGRPGAGATYTIDGVDYPASLVGDLTGTADWDNSVAPYFGVGWSKTPDAGGWGMFVDLGAMYTGAATATLAATGPIASDPTFQANLRQEEQNLNDDLENFEFYPVVRLGFMYRF